MDTKLFEYMVAFKKKKSNSKNLGDIYSKIFQGYFSFSLLPGLQLHI